MRESVKVKNLGKCWWREVWFGGCVPRRADDDDEKLGGWRGSVYLGGLRRAIDNWIPGNDGRDGRPTDKIGIKPIQPTTSQLQKSHQQVFKAYTFLMGTPRQTWTEGSKYCSWFITWFAFGDNTALAGVWFKIWPKHCSKFGGKFTWKTWYTWFLLELIPLGHQCYNLFICFIY